MYYLIAFLILEKYFMLRSIPGKKTHTSHWQSISRSLFGGVIITTTVLIAKASYKRTVEKKGLEFNLTKEEFFELIQGYCYYCGAEPTFWSPYINSNGNINEKWINIINNDYIYETRVKVNGVDRLDSNKGYDLKNCVSCCKQCNIMKNIYSECEFLTQVEKIYNFKQKTKNKI